MIKYILPYELSGKEGRPARRAPRGQHPDPLRSPAEFSRIIFTDADTLARGPALESETTRPASYTLGSRSYDPTMVAPQLLLRMLGDHRLRGARAFPFKARRPRQSE